MTHRFPIKEIANQSGLGPATVDRVLNNRANVSPQAQARVAAAVKELEAQESQLSARGRRLFVDVVVEAPHRFSHAVRRACEAVLQDMGEAVYRPRFVLQEQMSVEEVEATLKRIQKRGSQGVILKARDVSRLRAAVDDLVTGGIPVVTLVTDIPTSSRAAYVGIDNRAAGKTAAFLLAQMLGPKPAAVLTTQSQDAFLGETQRAEAFATQLRALRPDYRIHEITGSAGLGYETRQRLAAPDLSEIIFEGVYSMGGGNAALLDVLESRQPPPAVVLGHDLDDENTRLLRDNRLTAVLHHDLQTDMRHALRAISAQHGLAAVHDQTFFSDVQVITPFNMPSPQ